MPWRLLSECLHFDWRKCRLFQSAAFLHKSKQIFGFHSLVWNTSGREDFVEEDAVRPAENDHRSKLMDTLSSLHITFHGKGCFCERLRGHPFDWLVVPKIFRVQILVRVAPQSESAYLRHKLASHEDFRSTETSMHVVSEVKESL